MAIKGDESRACTVYILRIRYYNIVNLANAECLNDIFMLDTLLQHYNTMQYYEE